MILYEAPHRLVRTLEELLEALGDRNITICRELTKSMRRPLGPPFPGLWPTMRTKSPEASASSS